MTITVSYTEVIDFIIKIQDTLLSTVFSAFFSAFLSFFSTTAMSLAASRSCCSTNSCADAASERSTVSS